MALQHHPSSSPFTFSDGTPKTKRTQPGLGLLSQNSPNPLAQLNVQPHDHRNLVHGTTAPPPVICLHLFQRRAQNQAHAAQFRAFVPKTRQTRSRNRTRNPMTTVTSYTAPQNHSPSPASTFSSGTPKTKRVQPSAGAFAQKPAKPAHAIERVTPRPPQPHIRHYSTTPHRPPPPFPTARPKPSARSPVWGFGPKTANPTCATEWAPHRSRSLICDIPPPTPPSSTNFSNNVPQTDLPSLHARACHYSCTYHTTTTTT
jgi:hypothetical protein